MLENSKDVTFYLIGVHPDYQSKEGACHYFQRIPYNFTEKEFKLYCTPELADNHAIHAILEF
jgi:hypothetical protein